MVNEQNHTVKSFLDTDMYKLTMGQYVFHQHPNVEIMCQSKNRTKGVMTAEIIDERELRRELDRIQELRPTIRELDFLANQRLGDYGYIFKDDYLDFLAKEVNLSNYNLENVGGNFVVTTRGIWKNDIYWETPALATQNELYYRALERMMTPDQIETIRTEGKRRLEEKIKLFEENPTALFMEFGTRRRHSYEWQEYATRLAKERVPGNIVGTSNVYMAMKLGLKPMGTMAHEIFMVRAAMMAATDEGLRASHNLALDEWYEEYGPALSIALTDTFGTDFFFRDMRQRQAEQWVGQRQDSGNPAVFKKKQIEFYKNQGIDPRKKLFVPSDGLTVPKIVWLNNQLTGEIKQLPGLGTNWTNDFGPVKGFPQYMPISQVMKVVWANGNYTVKLSDNPAKATGRPEDIARYKKVFGYDETKYQYEECVY